MYCHICGKEIVSHSQFCCHCGTHIPQMHQDELSQKATTSKGEILWRNIRQHKFIILTIVVVILISTINFMKDETTTGNTRYSSKYESTIPSLDGEDERWDEENGIYANFKYEIAFNLTRNISWERISGIAKHTVVKFLQPDSGLTMYANIYPIGEDVPSDNIWDIYDEFIRLYKEDVLPYFSNNSALKVENYEHRKADICGKNAIKIECDFLMDDERYDGEKYTSVEYIFFYKNSMIGVGATCIDEWVNYYKKNDFTLEDFLRSFHLTPTYHKKKV